MYKAGKYDVTVIGAGHAGVEAALAAARLGCKTLMTAISLESIAMMPCNPSVGGPGKGQLVREVDALGGQMGINADETCIQFRMLNTGKGPAVQSLRAQADKMRYRLLMKETCENTENLDVKQLMIEKIVVEEGNVLGVVAETGEFYESRAVVLASGTYLQGRIIIGESVYDGGPNGQRGAMRLSASLVQNGIKLMRFKTGTPARVDGRSLDFGKMIRQPGDNVCRNFSFMSDEKTREQIDCWLTYTNEETHKIIRENMHRAPMANGVIKGVGPRYCPSIETKIARFPEKERHQLFLEPEGNNTNEFYVQGMSTSLPMDVQTAFLQTIPGLERAKIMRAGYAIEYDCIDPLQLKSSLEFKKIRGLFSAGQSNGSSGYEEAAAQGIMAGINAAMFVKGEEPLILRRHEAYIGVLIDDLVTKGTNEPYRMMTSRAEYRLWLREDNADMRLTPLGRKIGLVSEERWQRFSAKQKEFTETEKMLRETIITPSEETQKKLREHGIELLKNAVDLATLLRRPKIDYNIMKEMFGLPTISPETKTEIETAVKYGGYIKKQKEQIERMERMENKLLPTDMDYNKISGLRDEAKEKLSQIKPRSLGQASRISGVSPADISVLMIYLEQKRRANL